MKLSYSPYTLELKDTFTISNNSRKATPVVLVEIEHDGIIGFGEASLPPYLTENQQSVINFLKKVDLTKYSNLFIIEEIINEIEKIEKGNYAAKAAIDIALHDLVCKIKNIPLNEYYHIKNDKSVFTSITIGIGSEVDIIRKVKQYSDYKILKIKLGSQDDKKIIRTIRSVTDVPLIVDINQGWSDKYFALDFIGWLSDKNVLLIEQPLKKELIDEMAWLTNSSSIPIFADESVQGLDDIEKVKGACNGINIKLMKCGGILVAKKMIELSKEFGLQTMMGCMTETSCAISAASHLSLLTDFADLDGAQLIKNDPFIGMNIKSGEIAIPEKIGIGVEKHKN